MSRLLGQLLSARLDTDAPKVGPLLLVDEIDGRWGRPGPGFPFRRLSFPLGQVTFEIFVEDDPDRDHDAPSPSELEAIAIRQDLERGAGDVAAEVVIEVIRKRGIVRIQDCVGEIETI